MVSRGFLGNPSIGHFSEGYSYNCTLMKYMHYNVNARRRVWKNVQGQCSPYSKSTLISLYILNLSGISFLKT